MHKSYDYLETLVFEGYWRNMGAALYLWEPTTTTTRRTMTMTMTTALGRIHLRSEAGEEGEDQPKRILHHRLSQVPRVKS